MSKRKPNVGAPEVLSWNLSSDLRPILCKLVLAWPQVAQLSLHFYFEKSLRNLLKDTLLTNRNRKKAQNLERFDPSPALLQGICSTTVLQPWPCLSSNRYFRGHNIELNICHTYVPIVTTGECQLISQS